MSKRRKGKSAKRAAHTTPVVYGGTREMGSAVLRVVEGENREPLFIREADGAIMQVQTRSQNEGLAGVLRNLTTDALDWYLFRRLISHDQWSAGDWLRNVHHKAFSSGVLSVQYDGVHGVTAHTGFAPIPHKWEATLSLVKMLNAVAFARRGIVHAVCCWGYYANDAARRYGIGARRGVEMFRDGLDDLGRYRQDLRRLRVLADGLPVD